MTLQRFVQVEMNMDGDQRLIMPAILLLKYFNISNTSGVRNDDMAFVGSID